MKILHIPHAYPPVLGGVENQVWHVSEYLASLGHDVHVATANVASVEGYYLPSRPLAAPRSEIINGVFVKRYPFGNVATRTAWRSAELIPPGWGRGRIAGSAISCANKRFESHLFKRNRQL